MARDTLTTDRIVATAIELLDAEGLDGLNLRSLGKLLGSAATAVYWHVQNKDNLVRLAADTVWAEVELPDPQAIGWRNAAADMATSMHDMLNRHSWLGQAFGSYLLYGPGKARLDDHSLHIYETAGFERGAADTAAATVFIFVLGCSLAPAATVSLTRRFGRDGADAAQLMADTVARAREVGMLYPRLRERLSGPSTPDYAGAPVDTFQFGLNTILDGLQAQLKPGKGTRQAGIR